MNQYDRVVKLESSRPDEREIRGDASEFTGRMLLALALVAMFYAAWLVELPSAADWTGRALRIAPRLSVLSLGIFVALIVQGCRVKQRALLCGGIIAALGMLLLQGSASQFEILKLDSEAFSQVLNKSRVWSQAEGRVFYHAQANMLKTGPVILLLRFECALFAAVLLGTWIGRGAWGAWHFVTLLFFGAVTDVWVNWFHIMDSGSINSAVAALRLPFTPAIGGLSGGPGFTDILFLSAAFESARAFRMHTLSLVLGALAGYCSGSFLGLEPVPAWTHVSMTLTACGVLAAAWPDLKLDSNSIGKMFLAVALLILLLVSLVTLHHMLNPLPERRLEEEHRVRDLASFRMKSAHNGHNSWVESDNNWQDLCIQLKC